MKQILWKLFGVAAVALLHLAPAHAQATRTWVSGVGDDANPCSRTAPCKTFAGAISKTATGGEINVLDPGGFGGVTITKSITIRSDSIEAGVLVSGTNAIIVNAPTNSNVVLDGLDIEGLGTGLAGVRIIQAGVVYIRKSSIRNFTGNAVDLQGQVNARVVVEDCSIRNNGGGVNVQGAGGVSNTAFVLGTTIESSVNFAVQIAGPGNVVISRNRLIGTGPKLVISGGGQIVSYGDNVIRGGTTALPSSTIPTQ